MPELNLNEINDKIGILIKNEVFNVDSNGKFYTENAYLMDAMKKGLLDGVACSTNVICPKAPDVGCGNISCPGDPKRIELEELFKIKFDFIKELDK